ncbi:MAG: hypothetical protein K8T26_13090 [Lentisphaerae bacterium]|nr:hypothetical protein [Lentisphaerota bacterium]
MTLEEFERHVATHATPPGDMARPLQALWHAAKGNWNAAHELVQRMDSLTGSWIHGHLHRIEGDLSNAAHWYAHAGQQMPSIPVPQEREKLIHHFLHSESD